MVQLRLPGQLDTAQASKPAAPAGELLNALRGDPASSYILLQRCSLAYVFGSASSGSCLVGCDSGTSVYALTWGRHCGGYEETREISMLVR